MGANNNSHRDTIGFTMITILSSEMFGEHAKCADERTFGDLLVEPGAVPALAQSPFADGDFAAENMPGAASAWRCLAAKGIERGVDATLGAFAGVALMGCGIGALAHVGGVQIISL